MLKVGSTWSNNRVPTRAIITRSWLETALEYKPYINPEFYEKTFLTFKKWVKNIQTAGYNGASTVYVVSSELLPTASFPTS